MFEIVGREEELAALRAFIGEAEERPAALVLEGEAGIGKSTLWLAGVEQARAAGFRVLSARPAEAERGLAHAGLGDLFDGVLDDVLPALAPPRRRALEGALLLEEPASDRVDSRALGMAVRSSLQLLAAEERVLVAIDDVQWLDDASTRALAFALRRLGAGDVRLLLARRIGDGSRPAGLEQALEAERVRRLTVGPLSVGALHRFLRDRLGRPFARQTLLRIHERSGGNPFFALELARVLDADVDPIQPLPVPETLEELVRARISGLPGIHPRRAGARLGDRHHVAGSPASGPASRPDALEPAVASRVIERENGTIRFSHPLLSSVLYQDLGEERRIVHGRIARVVDDPLLHARHLALSRDTPDAGIAGVLDDAATLAADRGASWVAAELAEQALRLTPPDRRDDRRRRALAAARAHRAAGEWTHARAIATALLGDPEIGALRAECLILLAELESTDRAVGLLEEALRGGGRAPGAPVGRSTAGSRGRRVSGRGTCGRSSTPTPRSSSPRASTTTCSGRARMPCSSCSAGSSATHRTLAPLAGARLRDRGRRRPARTGGDARRREHARTVRETGRGPRPVRARAPGVGASATSRGAHAPSGASPGSSSGQAAGSWRRTTPRAPATSRPSTGSRCRRTSSRSR